MAMPPMHIIRWTIKPRLTSESVRSERVLVSQGSSIHIFVYMRNNGVLNV